MKRDKGPAGALRCPEDGTVFIYTTTDGKLYCHHQAHDGRPKSHSRGPAEPTRNTFSMEEAKVT